MAGVELRHEEYRDLTAGLAFLSQTLLSLFRPCFNRPIPRLHAGQGLVVVDACRGLPDTFGEPSWRWAEATAGDCEGHSCKWLSRDALTSRAARDRPSSTCGVYYRTQTAVISKLSPFTVRPRQRWPRLGHFGLPLWVDAYGQLHRRRGRGAPRVPPEGPP